MEQKDYLLREIEKIRGIMLAIRQKILGGKDDLSIEVEQHIKEEKGRLLDEKGFDFDLFLDLNKRESFDYVLNIVGFNLDNLELLADNLFEIGCCDQCTNSRMFLEKSLQMYELCVLESRTYSIAREVKIISIKNRLGSEN